MRLVGVGLGGLAAGLQRPHRNRVRYYQKKIFTAHRQKQTRQGSSVAKHWTTPLTKRATAAQTFTPKKKLNGAESRKLNRKQISQT